MQKPRFVWCFVFCGKKGLTAKAASEEICAVEGQVSINRSTASRWFKRFASGDLNLDDQPRSGRPRVAVETAVTAAFRTEPQTGTRVIAHRVGVSKNTVHRRLREMDFSNKQPRQSPHELTQRQDDNRVHLCQELLKNPRDHRFWRRIVTGDEKWVFLRNPDNRKQWVPRGQDTQAQVKQDRFGKKVMLSVWWNVDGILHFELVPEGRAVTGVLYAEQLERVHVILVQKYPALTNRKRVLLQHDNAPAHRSRTVQAKLVELDCMEILPHPAYSPDIAPSDYGLFRSLTHFLCGQQFNDYDEVKQACQQFFYSKPAS
jgi:[histone H3]-lysine36 N-dimethyltransferase SETMAR